MQTWIYLLSRFDVWSNAHRAARITWKYISKKHPLVLSYTFQHILLYTISDLLFKLKFSRGFSDFLGNQRQKLKHVHGLFECCSVEMPCVFNALFFCVFHARKIQNQNSHTSEVMDIYWVNPRSFNLLEILRSRLFSNGRINLVCEAELRGARQNKPLRFKSTSSNFSQIFLIFKYIVMVTWLNTLDWNRVYDVLDGILSIILNEWTA